MNGRSGEYLIGGGAAPGARPQALAAPADVELPPLVGWRFLLAAGLMAGGFAWLGLWQVHQVFEARDYRMEASRLQQIADQRQDRRVELSARVAHLQRAESLAAAGQQVLGMHSPEPGTVEQLTISWEARQRWLQAGSAVLRHDRKEQ